MAYSNPYAPVTNISLPYSCVIPGGLSPGKQIQIQGVVDNVPQANGFSINLCCGPNISPNCALHFNPRFTECCIVRNHMSNGSWGSEERGGGLPIVKGQVFEIIILVDSSGYKVAVNGRHFTEFKHRIGIQSVQNLHIAGDHTRINFVKYEGSMGAGGMSPPPYSPPGYGQVGGYGKKNAYSPGGFHAPGGAFGDQVYNSGGVHAPGGASGEQMYNPPVPLTQFVSGGMAPGRMIHISGVPLPEAKRFTINLKGGPSDYADINFHFDVRINMNSSNQAVVVRNHRSGGNWGNEERQASYFPFMPNCAFDLLILADPTCFKVAMNNQHYIQFPHRLPLQNATVLDISGDVRITTLRFQ